MGISESVPGSLLKMGDLGWEIEVEDTADEIKRSRIFRYE